MNSFLKEFQNRLEDKKIKIAVVGLGYVGFPLVIEFAKKGFSVLGIEIDRGRLNHIKKREPYITDVSSAELKRVIASGRFMATADFVAIRDCDVIFICVPTPLKRKYHPDIRYIRQAVKSISKNIKRKALVILESTTYPGTTEEVILPLLQEKGLRHNRDFYLTFSPERIDPGNKIYPLNKIPKVIGGISNDAARLAMLVYKNIIDKVVLVSSARVAETVKLLENTFRLVNIGLIDEIAMMAHRMGMDIWEIVDAAATKPFGFMPFYPGPGVGGHCIPKDPLYLYWKARHHGFRSRFIKLASGIISQMPEYVVTRVITLLKKKKTKLKKIKVLVVGVTYKRDIKDLRKSPAIDIIDILQKEKIIVSYYDPLIPYLKLNHINLKCTKLNKANLSKFDCVLVATDHSKIDYKFLLANSKLIFDTRNVFKNIRNNKLFRL